MNTDITWRPHSQSAPHVQNQTTKRRDVTFVCFTLQFLAVSQLCPMRLDRPVAKPAELQPHSAPQGPTDSA